MADQIIFDYPLYPTSRNNLRYEIGSFSGAGDLYWVNENGELHIEEYQKQKRPAILPEMERANRHWKRLHYYGDVICFHDDYEQFTVWFLAGRLRRIIYASQ